MQIRRRRYHRFTNVPSRALHLRSSKQVASSEDRSTCLFRHGGGLLGDKLHLLTAHCVSKITVAAGASAATRHASAAGIVPRDDCDTYWGWCVGIDSADRFVRSPLMFAPPLYAGRVLEYLGSFDDSFIRQCAEIVTGTATNLRQKGRTRVSLTRRGKGQPRSHFTRRAAAALD